MKKYLKSIVVLCLFPAFSYAQEVDEFQVESLTPAAEVSPDSTPTDTPSAVEAALQQAISEKFNYLMHNDLRDVMAHDRAMPGTSRDILIDISLNPQKYVGTNVDLFLEKNGGITAVGPVGHTRTLPNEKRIYEVTSARSNRRENAILSVTYERIHDVTGEDKVFDIDLLIFYHSAAKGGYFFRKVNIETTWKEKLSIPATLDKTQIAKTTLKSVLMEDVPLSETDFELHVELSTQKAILIDKNHNITRVFPVTAGALDVRTEGIDPNGVINSMTLLLPGASGHYKDFDFESSAIYKRSAWRSSSNQARRVDPSYYKGRPFIGIIDQSRVRDAGNLNQGYRGIGFHYQIDDSGLKRGFESHGCLRLQDHDLYTLDSILNQGPKDFIPVEVKMHIDGFENLDSIYRRRSSYNKVVYSTRANSPRTVTCKNKPSYTVRFFGGSFYHTVADSDCLTKVSDGGESLQDAVDYFTGASSYAPRPLIWGDLQHIPITKTMEEIQSGPYSYNYYSTLSSLFPGRSLESLNQSQLNTLLETLKAGPVAPTITITEPSIPVTQPRRNIWPYLTVTNPHPNVLANYRSYSRHCEGRLKNPGIFANRSERPTIRNCQAIYDALRNYTVRR